MEAIDYSLLAGGKRAPTLVLECAAACDHANYSSGRINPSALAAAARWS